MTHQELIPHLFRTEFSKIVAVLCKLLGIEHIEIAEDIAGETFLSALESWPYKGIPENPAAWLYTVAKNKAKNKLKRDQLFAGKITREIKKAIDENNEACIDLSDQNITDSQLQMLFAICHPSIAEESQIGLALRILCGFGPDEIANAFLTNRETINKRLFRAREKLRKEKIKIEFPGEKEIGKRIEPVLTILYLLFNEGYYSESQNSILREDLCLEAMRLTYLLIENEKTNLSPVNALLSLFCFHASRFEARSNENGEIVLYQDQDRSKWNYELINKGIYYLQQASKGNMLTKYHLEASIAYWHTIKNDTQEKWDNILQLYNRLLQVEYSPIAALNRTYALAKAHSKQEAIIEAEKLKLINNPYYYSLLGHLYTGLDNEKAIGHLKMAISLAKSAADRDVLNKRIKKIE
ncbi:MAG: sigma-70 family RNA polymerase sigma factor [Bacteroidetes bacterium]|nr:sigma-70 family RNA polymerase sigma factor [Bacteroidota bacterium]